MILLSFSPGEYRYLETGYD